MSQMTRPWPARVEAFIRQHAISVYLAFGLLLMASLILIVEFPNFPEVLVGVVVLIVSLALAAGLGGVSTLDVLRAKD